MKKIRVWNVAALLFVSGLCALAYQVVWLRELRLIFGSSTAATGMVLAVFMGGLGAGAFYLGRFADRVKNPLLLYATLELGITIGAVLSPMMIFLVRKLYLFLGGSLAMGLPMATLVRIILSALVLFVPTFMMGGTLPAVARAVETSDDKGRRGLALLYGVNTLGGVLGVGLTTFIFLESFGNTASLLIFSMLNLLVALVGFYLANFAVATDNNDKISDDDPRPQAYLSVASIPVSYIYVAALCSGFAFLLMEMVWYRMLAPLLGGSTYTFGTVLVIALGGIGIGGSLYSSRNRRGRPSVAVFAIICALEALFIAAPYWLGDRLVILTSILRSFEVVGFHGQLGGWLVVTCIVVLLPAIISGIQFPMLISLLGQGKRNVGRDTGYVYGWNTLGAILGSLAGGFGLIPLLSASGCWQLVAWLLSLLALGALFLSARYEGRRLFVMAPVVIVLSAGLLLSAPGPSETWQHRAIGAGPRVSFNGMDKNDLKDWLSNYPRTVIWQKDGVESSVALRAYNGLEFIVNGKSDGHAIFDASTQVMSSLIAAILHPEPKKAMVVGLGTGSSAGWLAEVPTMEQVDVVEIEPVIVEVAKRSAAVNFNVISHPKVRMILSDAREIMQVTNKQYDVIVSEPSNPYRAGIASLYTREFYESVALRLAPGGIFSQWVQSYSVDTQTVRTICATLASIFDDVEIWVSNGGDMHFVCSMQKKKYMVEVLRQKLASEPFKTALLQTWGVSGLEGFLAGFIGRAEVSRQVLKEEDNKSRVNTDDRMLVEFGFARAAGKSRLFSLADMRLAIREKNLHRPLLMGDGVDWHLVDDNFFRMMLWTEQKFDAGGDSFSLEQKQRAAVFRAFEQGNFQAVSSAWQSGLWKTGTPIEKAALAEALAETGDERVAQYISDVRAVWSSSADAIMARYYLRRGDIDAAFTSLSSAFQGFRTQPWQMRGVIYHALNLAIEMAYNKYHTEELFELLEEPFSVYISDEYRRFTLAMIGKNIGYRHAAKALGHLEPHVPWNEGILRYRAECYKAIASPLAGKAEQDLQEFLQNKSAGFFDL